MEILIERSGDEIHVSVPFALKDRAKKVNGYRWNPALKVWSFPNTQAVFRELIAEFGDNARLEGFDPPKHPAKETNAEPTLHDQLNNKIKTQESQLQSIELELSELKSELENKSNSLIDLETTLKTQNSMIRDLQKQNESLKTAPDEQKLKQSIEFWKRSAEEAEKKYEALVKNSSLPKPEPAPFPRPSSGDPFVQIVARAISIAGGDKDFELVINNTTLSRASLDIATAAEKKLRKTLAISSQGHKDFFSIIRQAAEQQVISDEARGLLNFIRQNRNRVAHDQLGQSEIWARSCIAILASSIVWPELEKSKT